MMSIIQYLQSGELSHDELEAKKVRKHAAKYTIMSQKLYKMRIPLKLRCLGEHEVTLIIVKVQYRAWSSHNGAQALAHKLLRTGYYWSYWWINVRCSFENETNSKNTLICIMHQLSSFTLSQCLDHSMSGRGHSGSFPTSTLPTKVFIVGIDYFTKWIETKVVSKKIIDRVHHLY